VLPHLVEDDTQYHLFLPKTFNFSLIIKNQLEKPRVRHYKTTGLDSLKKVNVLGWGQGALLD
jgi:hypothetical protein